jgi:NSS family neurotransmitter:Na+ symporter
MEQDRAQWKSRVGFLFAAIGSAVGLGNIWRFSYMCYENGGGAFMIPYFVALLTAGIPLMILEFAVGHKMRGSAPLSFAKIDKRWEWLGWWPVIFVMFGIVLYYAVIISWCLNYLFLSFDLSWGQDTNQFFFKEFLGMTDSPARLGNVRTSILFCLAIVWFLNWLIVYSGIERGIERANKFFIPILVFLTAVLVVWALNLPGAKEGIKQYLTPDFSVLTKTKVWINAYSQIFFTLSLGFGIMIAYSSYLPAKSDIAANAFIASLGNCAYSLFEFNAGIFKVVWYIVFHHIGCSRAYFFNIDTRSIFVGGYGQIPGYAKTGSQCLIGGWVPGRNNIHYGRRVVLAGYS